MQVLKLHKQVHFQPGTMEAIFHVNSDTKVSAITPGFQS